MPQLYCSWTLYNQLLARMRPRYPMNKPVNRTQHEVAVTQSISHQVNFQIFCSQVNKCFDVFGVFLMIYLCYIYIYTTGWWFQTFFIFPYIGNNQPNWLFFRRGWNHQPVYIYIINPDVPFIPQKLDMLWLGNGLTAKQCRTVWLVAPELEKHGKTLTLNITQTRTVIWIKIKYEEDVVYFVVAHVVRKTVCWNSG